MNNDLSTQMSGGMTPPSGKQPINFKLIIIIVSVIAGIGIIGGGLYFFVLRPSAPAPADLIVPLPEETQEPKELLPEEITEIILPEEESEEPEVSDDTEITKGDGFLPEEEQETEEPEAELPETEMITAEEDTEIDTDGDGLTDVRESELGTDAESHDSDNDGLFDREEIEFYGTDPLKSDTDSDGYSDGDEVRAGYNPLGEGRLEFHADTQPKN